MILNTASLKKKALHLDTWYVHYKVVIMPTCQPELPPQLLIASVVTYALFQTLYKKFGTKKNDPAATINGIRFLGYIGVHTVVWLWPPFLVLHFSGFEAFAVPYTMELFGLLVLNAIMDIVFNGCLLVCIALSSPLYAS